MEVETSPARKARANHRHDLRTLTYVVLDEANGGIIRNLNHEGVAVQAVAALRLHQTVRLRFELRSPRVRVEARGEVLWSSSSGQCGVRFLDLSPRMIRQINEWIFGNLLESIPQQSPRVGSMLWNVTSVSGSTEESDGLIISPVPRKVIELESQPLDIESSLEEDQATHPVARAPLELDWLSRPLSGRSLAWTVDSLVMVASLLLFGLVFLSVTHELPRWPLSLEAGFGAAALVGGLYWGFSIAFGGASLGNRLARLTGCDQEDDEAEDADRFR
jgi:PilZ domain-containing protein